MWVHFPTGHLLQAVSSFLSGHANTNSMKLVQDIAHAKGYSTIVYALSSLVKVRFSEIFTFSKIHPFQFCSSKSFDSIYQSIDYFHYPTKGPYTLLQSMSFLQLSSGQLLIRGLSLHFAFSRVLYKWSFIVYNLLYLASSVSFL